MSSIKNKLYVQNLSNKQPTKDITFDDIRYKIKKITSKKEKVVRVSKDVFFFKKKYTLNSRTKWS